MKKKHRDFQDYLMEKLQDQKFALAYLNEALNDEDQRIFLIALKNVLQAHKGEIKSIAQEAKLNRQNLYRMLSKRGNPRWDSLTSLFNTLGLQMQLLPKNN